MIEHHGLFERASRSGRHVNLYEEDRELFSALPKEGRLEARARAVAPLLELERGRWDTRGNGVGISATCLGLLVLDGLLVHSVAVGTEPRSELVGAGDVVRPWEHDDDVASVPFRSSWDVVHRARIAVLDGRIVALACRWPQLMPAVIGRATRRSRWLALQLALAKLRRVDDRLMLFFWHMADRSGRVRPDGVHVPLPVTHDVLAQLIGVQRPTVTSALRRLTDAGLVHRQPDKTWLLRPQPPAPVDTGGNPMSTAAARSTDDHSSPA
jgi:CRP/FNR family transcriptional regulator, cyclic AMP receptor protein